MIYIFSRHCGLSKISAHKGRPKWFSRHRCFRNLLRSGWDDHPDVRMQVFFDGNKEQLQQSYVRDFWSDDITCMNVGSEAASFAYLLWYIRQSLEDNDIAYFCEDDYLHRGDWVKILKEGFTIPGVNMVTLYDHADKYDRRMYNGLRSEVYVTNSCHWRTTPSTCHTFGTTAEFIRSHYDTWIKYCDTRGASRDHEQFIDLQTKGGKLVSSIPGYATHVQPPWLSPLVDWSKA